MWAGLNTTARRFRRWVTTWTCRTITPSREHSASSRSEQRGYPMQNLRASRDTQGHLPPSRRVPVLWPWVLVAAAWAVLVLAVLSHQTFLLDHHYLLQASGLPWLAALEIFLLCWQVMTLAMMLPSSMPMVQLVVYAGRKQGRSVAVALAFLLLYALIRTTFSRWACIA